MESAARATLVAAIATLCSGVPMVVLLTWGMDANLVVTQATSLMLVALLGNFLIGLPLALVCFRFIQQAERVSLFKLLILANFAAAVLVLIVTGSAGYFGTIFYGVPATIAANVFAIAGWYLVVKPARERARGASIA